MKKRRPIIERLMEAFGTRCYWCAGEMIPPPYGRSDVDWRNNPSGMTLEHDLQKKKGSKHEIHLRLAHRRCNQ